jgi:hypothetical protein
MTNTTAQPLRKIAVRKAGPVRLTAAAALLYGGTCSPWPIPIPPILV